MAVSGVAGHTKRKRNKGWGCAWGLCLCRSLLVGRAGGAVPTT